MKVLIVISALRSRLHKDYSTAHDGTRVLRISWVYGKFSPRMRQPIYHLLPPLFPAMQNAKDVKIVALPEVRLLARDSSVADNLIGDSGLPPGTAYDD